jgi:hypothetical protein
MSDVQGGGVVEPEITITGAEAIPHPLDPKGGTMGGRLRGGYRDASGTVHRTFVVREMGGVEEDLLGGKGVWVARLNQVIGNCLISVGTITDKREIAACVQRMPVVDRTEILIALYRLSHGDTYDFGKLRCPDEDCGEEGPQVASMRGIEGRDMAEPGQLEYVTTCSTGRVVRWHVMTGADEAWMYDVGKKRRDAAAFSIGLLARIAEIDGEVVVRGDGTRKVDPVFDAALARVQALTSGERRELREEIEEKEGDVDLAVAFTCAKCKHEWEGYLPVGYPGFFFPSVKRRR